MENSNSKNSKEVKPLIMIIIEADGSTSWITTGNITENQFNLVQKLVLVASEPSYFLLAAIYLEMIVSGIEKIVVSTFKAFIKIFKDKFTK
tara:strand:- start:57 stop:329 length:273 start_codon:yes stop_codon:yes gene_type:complete